MKSLLWIGDAGVSTGFAKTTHETLEVLRQMFDVTVLGINYRGDPHTYPYPIYAAAAEGDWMGIKRVVWMCDLVKPDVIVIQQDPWNVGFYVKQILSTPEYANVPIVASVAVDGKNFRPEWLRGVSLTIFWTQFGMDEARRCGFAGQATVIPLGVDLDIYHPIDRYEARSRMVGKALDDAFIVGNVNRNQPRKRWDLMVKYFAEWIHGAKIDNAWLYLHTAPTGDTGSDIENLARYYGIIERIALAEPAMWYGVSEDKMRDTYNCFDVYATTSQGEGFGLTTLEAMACGVPVIVPDWAALGDWVKGAGWLIPCSNTHVGPPYINVIGGVPDQKDFTQALDGLYRNVEWRKQNAKAGLERANEPRFRWANIGAAFNEALTGLLKAREQEDLKMVVMPS